MMSGFLSRVQSWFRKNDLSTPAAKASEILDIPSSAVMLVTETPPPIPSGAQNGPKVLVLDRKGH